jgi:hypothetical protein
MKALTLLSVFLYLSTLLYGQGPVEWNKSESYTHPSLVMYNSVSYLSLKNVDSGIEITNTEFWKTLDQLVPTEEPAGQDSLPDSSTFADGVDALEDPPPLDTASGLTSATNEAFVMQQYLDFLGRDGDAAGIEFWTAALDSGEQTRADCVNTFVFSEEFQTKVAPVSRLYLAYFLRIPDTAGLEFWINEKLAGKTLSEISNSFAESAEFQNTYGSLNNTDFVNLVYSNLYNRAADSAGFAYWKGQLDNGIDSRGTVMASFAEEKENLVLTESNIRVISFYYGMLRRAPEQAGYDFWVNEFQIGKSANELIEGFINSDEYQKRFN